VSWWCGGSIFRLTGREHDVFSADRTNGLSALGLFALVLLWLGTLLGVSFLATPAKFLAPSLTLPVALDVGRQTFAILNKLEWLYLIIALFIVASAGRRRAVIGLAFVTLVIVAQTFWMLPALDARVGMIIAGELPPPSPLHGLYISAEIAKLAALVVMAASTARTLVRLFARQGG
jgi:hypothetical protein